MIKAHFSGRMVSSLHREPPEVELVEKLLEVCIGGWSWVCHLYTESATALSDSMASDTGKGDIME